MLRFISEAVPEAFATTLECLWTVTAAEAAPHLILPDGCMDIVYWPEGGLRVVGTMTAPETIALTAGTTVTGLRFRPGAAAATFRVAGDELVDTWAALEDVWGRRGRALCERVAECGANHAGARMIASALPPPQCAPSAVQRAIAAMVEARGAVDLDWAARQARLSPRQFRRRCLEETGLTPKRLCRVLRFRHALGMAPAAHRLGWAAIAQDCGYSDQAHLIHEFGVLSGLTPAECAGHPTAVAAAKLA